MAACSEQKATTDRELLVLSEMLIARERDVEALRIQLGDAHARHDRSLRSLEVLAGHLDELHAQARGQATRIRMKALNEAALVTEKASDALDAVKRLQDARGVADGTPAIAGGDVSLNRSAAATNGHSATPPADSATFDDAAAGAPAEPASGEIAAAWAAPATDGVPGSSTEPAESGEIGFYHGDVEVEIGPLGDFSQLLGFESAAGGIAGASDISVRRFASGRATLGLRLDEPIELLRELEERAPFEFKVRQTGGGRRLIHDIDDQPVE